MAICPMNPFPSLTIPTPHRSLLIPSVVDSGAAKCTARRSFSEASRRYLFADPEPVSGDLDAARKAYHAKRAVWSKLDLRQDWADEAFMRGHIKAAGLRAPDSMEPATVSRLRARLARAGVKAPEILVCLGTTLAGYLELNPKLPLWAALALVLEATGRFPPTVAP